MKETISRWLYIRGLGPPDPFYDSVWFHAFIWLFALCLVGITLRLLFDFVCMLVLRIVFKRSLLK